MTVYSSVRSDAVSEPNTNSVSRVFNVVIFGVLVVLLGSYIFLSNNALSYQVTSSRLERSMRQLNSVAVEDASLHAVDVNSVTAFARETGMVENKEVEALFAHSGVALNQ